MRDKSVKMYGEHGQRKHSSIYIIIGILLIIGIAVFVLMLGQPRFPPYEKQTNVSPSLRYHILGTPPPSQNNQVQNVQNDSSQNISTTVISNEENSSFNNSIINQIETNENTINENASESMDNQENNSEQNIQRADNIALMIHHEINLQREKYGIKPLSFDFDLSEIARIHSEDMITNNYFAHLSPYGADFSERYIEAGYDCKNQLGNVIYEGGENLFQGWTYSSISYINGKEVSKNHFSDEEIVQNAVSGWMNSPGHRQNILTQYYNTEGIGVAISQDGKVLITENFC